MHLLSFGILKFNSDELVVLLGVSMRLDWADTGRVAVCHRSVVLLPTSDFFQSQPSWCTNILIWIVDWDWAERRATSGTRLCVKPTQSQKRAFIERRLGDRTRRDARRNEERRRLLLIRLSRSKMLPLPRCGLSSRMGAFLASAEFIFLSLD